LSTLHIHLDESGDFTFSPKGSAFYVFAVTWTHTPAPLAAALTDLRYSLLREGQDLERFHACEDKQAHRDAVVKVIAGAVDLTFAGMVVEKRMVNPVIRDPVEFYPKFASMLLRFVLRSRAAKAADRVLIYTDVLPVQRNRRAVEKTIKQACAGEFSNRKTYHLYHHSCSSNCWLQVTDYCSWALFKKWEQKDSRTYDQIKPRLAAAELCLTARGDQTVYY
jgi:hypothetical protein